jgi:dolichol-phosphate mannosyltransferase
LGRIVVVVPTYNEADNVQIILDRLRSAAPLVDVLVADDNSPDGTGKIADEIADADSRVRVLHRADKEGLGAAYIAGFRWAAEQGYDVVVEMDADGSHAPEDLPRLLDALRGADGQPADVVLGSRWVPGGKVVNWPRRREFLSRGGNLYTRLALALPLGDATGGFRAYRLLALQQLDLDTVTDKGYCFQVELAWRAVRHGFRVIEVPITFVDRERGQSKMDGRIMREALWQTTVWGVRSRFQRVQRAVRRRKD